MLRSALQRSARRSIPARRYLASSEYSAYEYPLATEAPEVTRTKACEVATQKTVTRSNEDKEYSPAEIEYIRQAQKQHLSTKLSTAWEITADVPSVVPPNFPADQLAVPETIISTLSNGVRVVSQETYGQVSAVGVVSDVGSRHERAHETGVTNLLEVLAFGATKQYSGPQVTTLLQDWGGQRFVSTGREQSLHCIDLLRPNVSKALDLLQQVLLQAEFRPDEVQDAKRALEFQAMDLLPEFVLGEALQQAAYGADQQLGQPHFCPKEALEHLTPEMVHEYWQRQFVHNPAGIVVAGAGVQHDFLLEQAEQQFGHLDSNTNEPRTGNIDSQYRGGMQTVKQMTPDGLVRMAVGFEVGGWHSDDLVATCVLQTLLGGGSSFSAGGPGKGMYSRLYRQVLNQYGWAESAEAYSAFHSESGLWGISGSTQPHKARDMVQVFTEHLAKLGVELVDEQELDRARNMLKCNVLTQLESRLVLFEDMGRQVLTYGQRECMNVTCEKIAAVTAEDVRQVAVKALQQPPTVAAVGEELSHVPDYHEVVRWL